MADPKAKNKALVVVTSHDKLGDNGHKTGYWLEEVAMPYYTFQDAFFDVTIASIKGGEPPVDAKSLEDSATNDTTKKFQQDEEAQRKMKNSVKLSEVNVDDYDAIFMSGGHGPMWDFNDSKLTKAIETFDKNKKPYGAVCHGVVAFVWAKNAHGEPLVKGREVTCFTDDEEKAVGLEKAVPFLLESRFREQGAKFSKGSPWAENVKVDGCMVSGQNPASSKAAAQAVIDLVRKGITAEHELH